MNSNADREGIRFIIPFEKKNKKNEKRGLTNRPFSTILNVSKERGIKKMKFTEEQIEFIGKCIDNTNIELYPGEWEELKKELRKGN